MDADKRTPEQKKLAEQAETLIKVTWDEIVDALPPADRAKRAELRRQANALEATRPPPPAQAWTIAEDGVTAVQLRPQARQSQPEGGARRTGFPSALTPPGG